jgi:hypothetical protein
MENWPPSLHDLSVPSERVILTREAGANNRPTFRADCKGVTVYQEIERTFSEGDRVQFTAPSKELHVANRQLGTSR